MEALAKLLIDENDGIADAAKPLIRSRFMAAAKRDRETLGRSEPIKRAATLFDPDNVSFGQYLADLCKSQEMRAPAITTIITERTKKQAITADRIHDIQYGIGEAPTPTERDQLTTVLGIDSDKTFADTVFATPGKCEAVTIANELRAVLAAANIQESDWGHAKEAVLPSSATTLWNPYSSNRARAAMVHTRGDQGHYVTIRITF